MAAKPSGTISAQLRNEIIARVGFNGTLLEFGSGESTLLFAEAGLHVTAVEHNKKWIKPTTGVEYIYAPIKQGWYDVDWTRIPLQQDAILIDGPPMFESVTEEGKTPRLHILRYIDRLDRSATFYVDDVHRPIDRYLANMLTEILERPGIIRKAEGKKYMVI